MFPYYKQRCKDTENGRTYAGREETIMNILGIIVILIAVLCIWRSYVRGLFRSVLIVGAMVVAMILSSYATPYVSRALRQYTKIDETIESAVIERLELDITQEQSTKQEQMQMIDSLPFPETFKLAVINNNNTDIYDAFHVQGFYEYLAQYLSCIATNCLAYLIIQIAITVGLLILLYTTNILTDIPILHGIDKTGGIALGVIQALAVIWSLFLFLSLFANTGWGTQAFAEITGNPVLNFLYEHNWLMDIVTNVTKVLFLS